jgi:hypothetical protein
VQPPAFEKSRRLRQGNYLGVGRRVGKLLSLVIRARDYPVFINDDRPNRNIAVFLGNFGSTDGRLHKPPILSAIAHR